MGNQNTIVTPPVVTTPVATEPVTPPATPPVTPPATPPVTPPTPPTASPIDTATIEKNVSESVSKSVIEKIGEALGLNKKEKEQLPTDPDELRAFVESASKKSAEAVLAEKENKEKEANVERERQIEEGSKRYQQLWSGQYEALSSAGKLPKIVDATDANDPGRQAKTKLLIKLYEVLQENEKNGIDEVPTIKEIYYEYPEVLKGTIPGGTAPISGGGRNHASGTGLNYSDIHNQSFEEILSNG